MKKLVLCILAAVLLFSFAACTKEEPSAKIVNAEDSDVYGYVVTEVSEPTNYVKIEMVGGGFMLVELYPDAAPITVANFQKLVGEGFYDGLIFHRVIAGFMIQGGDIDGDGFSDDGAETIKGEFALNGVNNAISHVRGVLSMARTQVYDSASTQFFITHVDRTDLDGQYAAFGKVIAGMDVVDAIAAVKTDGNDRPETEVKIVSVRFVTIADNGSR